MCQIELKKLGKRSGVPGMGENWEAKRSQGVMAKGELGWHKLVVIVDVQCLYSTTHGEIKVATKS